MSTANSVQSTARPSVNPARVNRGDRLFEVATTALAGGSLVILALLLLMLFFYSWDSIVRYGLFFFVSTNWDPVFEEFGAAHFIYGTLVTSLLALIFATPLSVGTALFLTEYARPWLAKPVSFTVELLAVIPSIIYGLWGFFVLAPFMKAYVEPALKTVLESIPLLNALVAGPVIGRDYLIGGMILAIMIIPTVMAVAREVLAAVPPTQREGMLALGATKWETIQHAVLPYARAGIAGAAVLGLARALGETMAVTMVIGNSAQGISASLFTPGYTMASAIANQFTEADKEIYFSAIVEVGLALLLVSTLVNVAARLLVWRFSRGPGGQVRA